MSNPIKEGKRYRFRDLVFWACNGMVYMEDQRDGDFQALTQAEAFARAKSIAGEVKNIKYYDEQMETLNMIEDMASCVKDAIEQGDPMDEDVRIAKAREIKRGRDKVPMPNRILLPGGQIPGAAEAFSNNDPIEIAKKIPSYKPRKNGKKR